MNPRNEKREIPARHTEEDKAAARGFCSQCCHYKRAVGCIREKNREPIPVSALRYACKYFNVPDAYEAPAQELDQPKMRRCAVCGEWKPVTEFWKVPKGFSKACRNCAPTSPMGRLGKPKARKTKTATAPKETPKPAPNSAAKQGPQATTRKDPDAVRIMSTAIGHLAEAAARMRREAEAAQLAADALLKNTIDFFKNRSTK